MTQSVVFDRTVIKNLLSLYNESLGLNKKKEVVVENGPLDVTEGLDEGGTDDSLTKKCDFDLSKTPLRCVWYSKETRKNVRMF